MKPLQPLCCSLRLHNITETATAVPAQEPKDQGVLMCKLVWFLLILF